MPSHSCCCSWPQKSIVDRHTAGITFDTVFSRQNRLSERGSSSSCVSFIISAASATGSTFFLLLGSLPLHLGHIGRRLSSPSRQVSFPFPLSTTALVWCLEANLASIDVCVCLFLHAFDQKKRDRTASAFSRLRSRRASGLSSSVRQTNLHPMCICSTDGAIHHEGQHFSPAPFGTAGVEVGDGLQWSNELCQRATVIGHPARFSSLSSWGPEEIFSPLQRLRSSHRPTFLDCLLSACIHFLLVILSSLLSWSMPGLQTCRSSLLIILSQTSARPDILVYVTCLIFAFFVLIFCPLIFERLHARTAVKFSPEDVLFVCT